MDDLKNKTKQKLLIIWGKWSKETGCTFSIVVQMKFLVSDSYPVSPVVAGFDCYLF